MTVDIEAVTQVAKQYADDVRRVMPVDKVMLFGSYAKYPLALPLIFQVVDVYRDTRTPVHMDFRISGAICLFRKGIKIR